MTLPAAHVVGLHAERAARRREWRSRRRCSRPATPASTLVQRRAFSPQRDAVVLASVWKRAPSTRRREVRGREVEARRAAAAEAREELAAAAVGRRQRDGELLDGPDRLLGAVRGVAGQVGLPVVVPGPLAQDRGGRHAPDLQVRRAPAWRSRPASVPSGPVSSPSSSTSSSPDTRTTTLPVGRGRCARRRSAGRRARSRRSARRSPASWTRGGGGGEREQRESRGGEDGTHHSIRIGRLARSA